MHQGIKNSIYELADLLTLYRGIPASVNGESIRFAPHWSRYFPAAYEPQTFQFLKDHCPAGGTVIDLGAHIGLFSVVAARLVGPNGKVFAFEPTDSTRKVLEQTIKRNSVSSRVEVRSEAVGESAGTAQFFQLEGEVSVSNSLISYGELSRSGTEVSVVSLDEFVAARGAQVNFLKIDVEGAELQVLRGAANTFAMRPFVSLGLHPEPIATSGGSLEEIWALLAKYRMSVTEDGTPLSQQEFCGRTDRFDVQLCPL
jgi:FkbM family methyltransferase